MKAANESAKELKRKNYIGELFGGNKVGTIWLVTYWGGAFHLSTANTCCFGYSLVWLLIWMVAWETYWNSIFLLMIWNNHLDFLEQDSHTHTHPCFSWISDIILVSVRCLLCIFLFCWFHCALSLSKSSWLHCAGCSLCQFVTKRGRRFGDSH